MMRALPQGSFPALRAGPHCGYVELMGTSRQTRPAAVRPGAAWLACLGLLAWAASHAQPGPAGPPEQAPAAGEPVAPPPPPPPIVGDHEVLAEPGFLVHYQNCDGTLPTADRLTLPRPLSSRYTGMRATVRASLDQGKPILVQMVDGDAPLFEAIQWHVERARFAAGPPACVLLHYQVVDTVAKAAEIVEFRVWVDALVRSDGEVEPRAVADELADADLAAEILAQADQWTLEPPTYGGRPVDIETSLRVKVRRVPSGWTTWDTTTEFLRRGPRPVETPPPRTPRRLALFAYKGTVLLEFWVSEKGKPLDVRVVRSEPKGVFDNEALGLIRRWRYKPDVVNGETITSGPIRQVIMFDTGLRPDDVQEKRKGGLSIGG